VLGIDASRAPHRLSGAVGEVEKLLRAAPDVNAKAVALGVGSLAVVLIVHAVSRMLPGTLLAVVAGAGTVALMGWTQHDLPLVGAVPRSLPELRVPRVSWSEAEALLGGALALALLGMLESVSIAKSIAAHTGERISANQEFFAQGFKNAFSSFFQCIPGSGSFTRSALDHAAGAATRFAAVYNALFVALLFWIGAGWAGRIPLASLGAVLVVIGFGLIDFGYIPRMFRASRPDAIVCAITFGAAMVLPLELAIFLGIFLNLALYLRTASRLHVSEMIHHPGGVFHERPIVDKHTGERQVVFLQLEGDLFFAVADDLQHRLNGLAGSTVRVVILRLKRTHSIDATVLAVLEKFVADMRARQRYVVLCGVKTELMSILRAYGLVERIGPENVFATGGGIFTSAKRALDRARTLVGHSIDTSGIDTGIEDSSEPNYVI
jgi:SulP family sulfate permease